MLGFIMKYSLVEFFYLNLDLIHIKLIDIKKIYKHNY
jgi:hypothetical protein